MSILDYFPEGMTPRDEQATVLREIEARWHEHDVFVVVAPTAAGKTPLMRTIANWRAAAGDTATISAPNNIIMDQINAAFPAPILRKRAAYHCSDLKMSCAEVVETAGQPCLHCPYTKARNEVRKASVRYANYYVYWSAAIFGDVVLFDEAHQLVEMLVGKSDIKLKRKQYNFPAGMKTVEDVVVWIQRELNESGNPTLGDALQDILKIRDGAAVEYVKEERDEILWIKGQGAQVANRWLWPAKKVRKIVLLSATLSSEDVRELGLENRRITYLEMPSVIPPDRRRLVFEPALNMALRLRQYALPALAKRIEDLLEIHPEKGLVHIPYAAAAELRQHLDHPRLRWHGRKDKAAALKDFREAADDSGMVLVVSGLYEGVDLPYDAARWQVIAAVPFLSWGDARIVAKAEEHPDWYDWEAIKRIIQATGRIVRAPDDFGVTYLFDNNFERLLKADAQRPTPLIPSYFKEAVRTMKIKREPRSNGETQSKGGQNVPAPVPIRRPTG